MGNGSSGGLFLEDIRRKANLLISCLRNGISYNGDQQKLCGSKDPCKSLHVPHSLLFWDLSICSVEHLTSSEISGLCKKARCHLAWLKMLQWERVSGGLDKSSAWGEHPCSTMRSRPPLLALAGRVVSKNLISASLSKALQVLSGIR